MKCCFLTRTEIGIGMLGEVASAVRSTRHRHKDIQESGLAAGELGCQCGGWQVGWSGPAGLLMSTLACTCFAGTCRCMQTRAVLGIKCDGQMDLSAGKWPLSSSRSGHWRLRQQVTGNGSELDKSSACAECTCSWPCLPCSQI